MPAAWRGTDMLDPSWKRVASFTDIGPSSLERDADEMDVEEDGQWEYEDEEELVTLDLGPDSKRLVQMSQEYAIAGLETETPFLQLGNLMFKGTWDQLIGTEILLQDEQQTRTPHRGHEHDLWPLSATATDRRLQRAPSTTRRRIVMRQATNMVAKEAALVPPDELPSTGVHAQAPILRRNKTGYVTYKTWVWVRGIGWMRKEEASQLDSLPGSALEDGQTSQDLSSLDAAQGPEDLPDEREELIDDEGGDGEEEEDEDVTEAQVTANVEDASVTHTVDQSSVSAAVAVAGKQEASRQGRKKMTEEEKVRYQLLRAMRKVANRRRGVEQDGEDQSGDEE